VHKRDQISQMAAIYQNAMLTIVAADGIHTNAGLPGVGRARHVRQKPIFLWYLVLVPSLDATALLSDDEFLGRNIRYRTPQPRERRAWVLQEGLFSRRMLYFTERQVYWHCASATLLEEIVLEGAVVREPPRINTELVVVQASLIPHDDGLAANFSAYCLAA